MEGGAQEGRDGAGQLPRVPAETVEVIAQAVLGASTLAEPARELIAADVEYRVREVVQEATKFMRHAKRGVLTMADLQAALRQLNVEPVYGLSQNDPVHFASIHAAPGLYYVPDKEISIAELVRADLPPLPSAVTLSLHWLAVNGTQPIIAENAAPASSVQRTRDVPSTGRALSTKKRRFEFISTLPVPGPLAGSVGTIQKAEIKPVKKHVLSKELSMYLYSLTEAMHGNHADLREAALVSVSEEPGLQSLLPYLVQYVEQQVSNMSRQHAFDLNRLRSCMQLARAILRNPYFDELDKYLHTLLPSIMTCLVGKRLCETKGENHWELRDCAADILMNICLKFGSRYSKIQPHITKTLSTSLQDTSKALTSQYGAVVGLSVLGPHVIESILIQFVRVYSPVIDEELESASSLKKSKLEELCKLYGAFMSATAISVLGIKAMEPRDAASNASSAPAGFRVSSDTNSVLFSSARQPLGDTAMSDSPHKSGLSGHKWIPLWHESPRVSFPQLESASKSEKSALEQHIKDFYSKLTRLRGLMQTVGSSVSCLPFQQ